VLPLALTVLAGPLGALALIGLVPPLRRSGRPAAFVAIAGTAVALMAAAALAAPFVTAAPPAPAAFELVWMPLGTVPAIPFGLLVDGLSASMAVLVALVALLVQVYSLAYMAGEPPSSLGRYFAYHALFAFAMLGLVLAHNLLQTYVCWELVGLGSYLLIGFWFDRPAAGRAALKAFWTTRLGDVGFALGIVVLWSAAGTFTFAELFAKASSGAIAGGALTLGMLGIYAGAMGKSAQAPLHVWLPDAMEGPTPVSALIHAATMVAAGVYLMIRVAPLLALTPAVAEAVFVIGVATALLGASMALVERDLKRILAHSTVSQLGFMMAAVGSGGAAAAYFHLLTHGFFKALLFLAAGSLIHAFHTNDIFSMGRAVRAMPVTSACFAAGALALAGILPASGFFSKDEVLAAVLAGGHPVGFAILVGTAALTAFYIGRALLIALVGAGSGASREAHDPPPAMTAPMLVLAVPALAFGIAGPTVSRLVAAPEEHAPVVVPILGTLAALGGAAAAWVAFRRGALEIRARGPLAPLIRALERRWYLDAPFEWGYRVLHAGVFRGIAWLDRYVVDGAVNALAWGTWGAAGRLRAIQNGRVQDALYAVAAGLVLLAWLAWGA